MPEVSVICIGEAWGCATFTAAIHSARSSGGKLLHSRRTDGFEHGGESFATTDCASRMTAPRASPMNREIDIQRDRDAPSGSRLLWAGGRRETRG